jgi:hypothetical protein
MSVLFLHHLERCVQAGGSSGRSFVERLWAAVKRLEETSSLYDVAEEGRAASILRDSLYEYVAADQGGRQFIVQFIRKKDRNSPTGYFYYSKQTWKPYIAANDTLTAQGLSSVVALYEHLYFTGDRNIRFFLFGALYAQLMLYDKEFGPPSLMTLGKAPNIGVWMFFGFPENDVLHLQNAYLAGGELQNWNARPNR